jgi:hypothetical protein
MKKLSGDTTDDELTLRQLHSAKNISSKMIVDCDIRSNIHIFSFSICNSLLVSFYPWALGKVQNYSMHIFEK